MTSFGLAIFLILFLIGSISIAVQTGSCNLIVANLRRASSVLAIAARRLGLAIRREIRPSFKTSPPFCVPAVAMLLAAATCFSQTPIIVNPLNATGVMPYATYDGTRENTSLVGGNCNVLAVTNSVCGG